MNADPDIIDTEACDVETGQPVTAPPASTALAAPQENPYLTMASRALDLGKVDQLDKLLDLQLKWDAAQAAKAFTAAMAAFKADPIVIEKRKLVEFETRDGDTTSYRHATLADVVDAVVAGMGKHGLSHRWDVKQEGGQVAVTCTVTHRDGHSESVTMQAAPDNSGKKNSIQQVASTVTYLQRYTLMAATGVAAKDMDDDGIRGGATEQEANITEEQAKILSDLIEMVIRRKQAFMDWVSSQVGYKIEDIALLPVSRFDRIHDELARIQREREAGNNG